MTTTIVQHGPGGYVVSGLRTYRSRARCATCRAPATHRAGYRVDTMRPTEFGYSVRVTLFSASEVLCRECYAQALDAMEAVGMKVSR